MNARDVRLIAQIREATDGAARLLCTLARRGKALEREEPQRMAFLLTSVRTHPLYKGGRLAFDMLEIEDLILDGSTLAPMSTREIIQVLNAGAHRFGATLIRMESRTVDAAAAAPPLGVDTNADAGGPPATDARADEASPTPMPRLRLGPADGATGFAFGSASTGERLDSRRREFELQASDYIYDYVVLGFLDIVADGAASSSEAP